MPSQNNGIKLVDFQYLTDCRNEMQALQKMILPLMKDKDGGIQTLILCHQYQPYGGIRASLFDLNTTISYILLEHEGKENLDGLIEDLMSLKDKLDVLEFDREEYPRITEVAESLKEHLSEILMGDENAVDLMDTMKGVMEEQEVARDLEELERRYNPKIPR